jgi:hypothetical protein
MSGVKENYQRLKADLLNMKRNLALAAGLRKFFRERITLRQAEEEIKRLLDSRVDRFLELARQQGHPLAGRSSRHSRSRGKNFLLPLISLLAQAVIFR